MLNLHNLYYNILNIIFKFLIRSKIIPKNPIEELELNLERPIIYVLPYNSTSDLLTVRAQCLAWDLPDPLDPFESDGHKLPRYVFIESGSEIFPFWGSQKESSIQVFHEYLDLHKKDPSLDVQLIPVSVMFGRAPSRGEKSHSPRLRRLNGIQKFFAILWMGRDCFVRFSRSVSLHQMAEQHGADASIAQKLVRVARLHFSRQRMAAIGPNLPVRQALFNKLLSSDAIKSAIQEEAYTKKISIDKAKENAVSILDEIAANFTYNTLRITERCLTWTWNRLYQGLYIHNAERIRQFAQDGYELVYAPCHRSHMDYLLLSYVLYHQGLVPPHIAAGVNLNFWPAGPIFRRLGAFFIRRSFKGNKLYSIIFREYLAELFSRGYSVEYFVEGGRSRTGRLLEPKTGTLSMTIHAHLRGNTRPIMIIPVYIGYEHVLEVATYAKELRGAAKERENLLQVLRALRKLRKLGYGYVNFGEPISLNNYLNEHAPDWRSAINLPGNPRPSWLAPVVSSLAAHLMTKINDAAAVNAMNLCCTALLSSRQRALTREQLIIQLDCYLKLLKNIRYSSNITIPTEAPEQLFEHALQMNKFQVEKDNIGEIITLPREQAILMTYYRNNIHHLLVLPSLIANITLHSSNLSRQNIIKQASLIYPLIQAELFMHYPPENIADIFNQILDEYIHQELLVEDNEQVFTYILKQVRTLQLLAAGVRETLQRYAITLVILHREPDISRGKLEKESLLVAQRLSVLHGINAPEFFDKAVFSTLITTLRHSWGEHDDKNTLPKEIETLYQVVTGLITPEIILTINSVTSENKED